MIPPGAPEAPRLIHAAPQNRSRKNSSKDEFPDPLQKMPSGSIHKIHVIALSFSRLALEMIQSPETSSRRGVLVSSTQGRPQGRPPLQKADLRFNSLQGWPLADRQRNPIEGLVTLFPFHFISFDPDRPDGSLPLQGESWRSIDPITNPLEFIGSYG